MNRIIYYIIWISLPLTSCNKGPKVITAITVDSEKSESSTGIFSEQSSVNNSGSSTSIPPSSNLHNIEVEEVLPTEKYVYLRVREGEEKYWVATNKRTVRIGEKYFFNGGLLKTNFESKEYNRVFDKVYLVSNLIPNGSSQILASSSTPSSWPEVKEKGAQKMKSLDRDGSTKIAMLVGDPKKYEGEIIQLTGECVKLNHNIMGRNWIHLKDGSKDDYDLVVTSDAAIPEGHVVTLTGVVSLNKDFGAGYRYDIIVENASIMR